MKRSSSGVSRYNNSASCPPTIANNLYTYFDATMNRVLLIRAFRYRLQPFQEIRPRATSHTGLRARDHYTSSSLVGGKRRSRSKFALHNTWRTHGVYEWKMDVKSTWILTWHQIDSCFMVTWIIFKNHLCDVHRPNTKLGDHGTPNVHNRWFFLFYYVWGPA